MCLFAANFSPYKDSLFQDDSCSTFAHDLLCIGGADAVKYWFMTAAEDWPEVTDFLRSRDGSNTIRTRSMSLQEFSQAPFRIHFHMQRKGDLVILPPRRCGIYTPHSPSTAKIARLVSLKRFIGELLQVFAGTAQLCKGWKYLFITTGSLNSGSFISTNRSFTD